MKDRLRGWLLKRWWGRNLANIITLAGFVGAYWILFCTSWSVPGKLAGYVVMEILDWVDGKVARWLGVADGIGKIIDPTIDKLKKFFVLYFLFQNPTLVFRIVVGFILLGEIAVLILIGYAEYIVFKHSQSRHPKIGKIFSNVSNKKTFKEMVSEVLKNCRIYLERNKAIFKETAAEVLKNWRVSQEGKLTMVCYVAMFGAILLQSIWLDMDIFTYLYVSLAIIGFVFRSFSFVYYWKKFLEWQNKASAKATQGGLV